MVAKITSISPTQGPTAGGTPVTLTGTGFLNCLTQVAWRNGGSTLNSGGARIVSDTQITYTTIGFDSSWNQATVDVGVYDNVAKTWVWLLKAFFVGAPPATLTSVAPAGGPVTGGTALTVTGTKLTQCQPNIYLRQGSWQIAIPAVATATTLKGTTPDLTGRDGAADVGAYDTAAGVWLWLPAAFYIGVAPVGSAPGVWDQTKWDGSFWQARRFAPGAGWGYDWRVWYQYGGQILWDMTDATVEARWTTDGHTPGDGTFRGDLQPGALQLQVHDPAHVAETLSKLGTIWLHYGPSNFTWGFYLDTVTRQLVAPNDATAADVVIQGSVWPLRLTTDCTNNFTRAAERADNRLNALAAFLNQNANLNLPGYDAAVAAQSHVAPAVAQVAWAGGVTPSALSILRTAAADGVAWIDCTVAGSGLGRFRLNYARWETGTRRNLTASDVVAGIPYDSSMEDVITHVEWDATGPDGSTTTVNGTSSSLLSFGESKVTMRVLGDMKTPGSPDISPIMVTSGNLMSGNANPTQSRLSTVTATSGPRITPAGADSTPWNPAAHVWSPTEILHWIPPPGSAWGVTDYWVTKTAHRLRAAGWDSAHTLEPYTAASPLPA